MGCSYNYSSVSRAEWTWMESLIINLLKLCTMCFFTQNNKGCTGFSEIHLKIMYCTYKQKSQKATFLGEIFSAFIVLQESFVHLDCKIWLFFAWTVQESNVKLFWWVLPGTAIAIYVKIGQWRKIYYQYDVFYYNWLFLQAFIIHKKHYT